MTEPFDPSAEWLETDGLGGFAMGTASGLRTRRYHGLLVHAAKPPSGRVLLVAGLDASLETPAGTFALSSQAYAPDTVHPDGIARLESFCNVPWPRWRYRIGEHTVVEQELFMAHGSAMVVVSWKLVGRDTSAAAATLDVRPFLAGRDYHALVRANDRFRFTPEQQASVITFRCYDGTPQVLLASNAAYRHEPNWYYDFRYDDERDRGFDHHEDLANPGVLRFDLAANDALLVIAAEGHDQALADKSPASLAIRLRAAENRRRRAFASSLHRAADAYVVRRGNGRTLVAGYPWFTDWGRDTFIAMRGITLTCGRLDVAKEILLEWSGSVSQGMLPNRFPDRGDEPEYNSVDASLWYVIVVGELLTAARRLGFSLSAAERTRLASAVDAILQGYSTGTRYGIGADDDGLLWAGGAGDQPGSQLTWMDARVDGQAITPRTGKPVEIQALWINALRSAARRDQRWRELAKRAAAAFGGRFWNQERGCLYDVVDVGRERGAVDASMRPNQIFAVGGLPYPLLRGRRARQIVDVVERELLTPLGLRSLAPGEPGYASHYRGGPAERDGAYHQGTVWPWLIGPFVEAWVRVRGNGDDARIEARKRFLPALLDHLGSAGLGHVSEVLDAEMPFRPGGCPFQAWSVGELLRLDRGVLALASTETRHAASA